jgi:diadenosine tetraphosphatase ApaH/serine/threonine PP2A family protein phosphatase
VVPLSKRIAVISDVHGNWHALEAVLAAVAEAEPDEIWCLGDLVGYGPRPNECCNEVAERAQICLAGNHDLVVLDHLDLDEFSPDAATSALWTRDVLSEQARRYLTSLPSTATVDGVGLYHASPRDPVWEYVLSTEAALAAFALTEESLVLVGHSHVALAILLADRLVGGLAADGVEVELGRGRWLLNPGSVGQPRDGDPRAAFLLLEQGERATFRRVSYPIKQTQAEILERGLPDALAERLADGV